ncbi:MFS transporter [Microbacterium caowuchunii]|uniref:MFS transporter n=1 Tax=Microbacterium caowuchunii TaxID=2614638 RepID=A0A5N0TL51_9MICO|nr:MFS transporter [Microbacterium caowuchunii]KAA9135732.1 MFS transporter [Microbacterium caowuchunii]
MKRSFSLQTGSPVPLLVASTGLIAATYGLIRLAYGLFLPDVQEDLGLGPAAAGAVSGGASIMYCVAALVGFFTAARHSRALVLLAGAAGAAGAAGMAAAGDATWFAAFAIVGSAGAGLASPALVAIVQQNPATRGMPRAQAIVNAGTGPGLIGAAVLAILLLPDWRLAWWIAAGATVIVTAAVTALGPRGRPNDDAPAAFPPPAWFRTHLRPIVAALLMGAGCAAVWNFGRVLLVDAGAGATVSVLSWGAIGVGGAAVIVTARWVERMSPALAWILTTSAIAAATAILPLVPGLTGAAIAACVVFGWAYMTGSGALIRWTAALDPDRAPAGTALLFVTLILGQAVGATVLGAFIGGAGYPLSFLAAASVALLAVLPALRGLHPVPLGGDPRGV